MKTCVTLDNLIAEPENCCLFVNLFGRFSERGQRFCEGRDMSTRVERCPDLAEPETSASLADRLDRRIQTILGEVEKSETYRVVADPRTDPRLVAAIVRWYLLEVFSFGPHVTEATFTAIGRMPKNRPDLMKPMILHDLEEVDHGEMALQDYLKLGGDEHFARTRRLTPASLVMAATCRMIAERENPFCYLGYMYFFEALTPFLTERAQKLLAAKGFPLNARYFIDYHAQEDVSHARQLRDLLDQVVRDYPEAGAAIEYGFECFAAVYPLPIWTAALENARKELAGHDRDSSSTNKTSMRDSVAQAPSGRQDPR